VYSFAIAARDRRIEELVDKWGSSQKATVHAVMHYSAVSKLLAKPRFKDATPISLSQIAWAKLCALRDGAAIASKKLWS
jgi:hypothetical protein